MEKNNTKILEKRKRKIAKRLERKQWKSQEKPMFAASNIHDEIDGRHCGPDLLLAIHLLEPTLTVKLKKVKAKWPDHRFTICYHVSLGLCV